MYVAAHATAPRNRILIVAVDALSIFKSPMILIAIFSLAMVLGLPYIMDNRAFLRDFLTCLPLTDHSRPGDQGRVRGHAEGSRNGQRYRCSKPGFHRQLCQLDVGQVGGCATFRTEAEEKDLETLYCICPRQSSHSNSVESVLVIA
jgi:hypothetical protein